MRIIEMFFDSLVVWIAAYYVGIILFQSKNRLELKHIILILLFSTILLLINMTNIEILNGVIKLICTYILQCIFYKVLFNKSFSKCMLAALMWYLCLIIAESILGIIASIVLNALNISTGVLKNNIVMNVLIALLDLVIVYVTRKNLVMFINNQKYLDKSVILIIIVILVTLALIGFKRPISTWKIDIELIISTLILFGFCILGLYLLKQRSDIQKTSLRYQEVVKFSNTTNKVLENYRMVSHEHKNQLSIIRQMVNKNNKELLDYIDNLINKRNDIRYKWVTDLNNLPDEGLKGLVNYKLLEAEENGINVTVIITKEVFKVKLNKLNTKEKDELYSIVGIYLDNAIQAAIESKDKEINLEIYKDKKDLVLVFGNTYKGNINIKKIDNYGYSTKGKNHGVGLHIVKNILDNNTLFSQNRKLLDNYYVQNLIIHTNNIKYNRKVKK